MQIKNEINKPIFMQIAEGIEDGILSGTFAEETQIPSITEFSVTYKINPATALKGITLLVEEGIVYKKRGLGMFVTKGAIEKLHAKRKEEFYAHFIAGLIREAKQLHLSREEIQKMIERGYDL